MNLFARWCTWVMALLVLASVSSVRADIVIDVPGQGHALLIGIDEHDAKNVPSLSYPAGDVRELATVLIAGGYSPAHVVVMGSKTEDPKLRATAENIRGQLKLLSKLSADVVLIVFSGNSVSLPGADGLYWFPVDGSPDDKERLIAESELYKALAESDAKLRLVLWDSNRETTKVLPPPPGILVLFGCQDGHHAYEAPDLAHGLFSYFVIHALRGAGDFDHDGAVTLPELELFTARGVSEYGALRGIPQLPDRVGQGPSLQPIVILDWARGKSAGEPRARDDRPPKEEPSRDSFPPVGSGRLK